MKKLFITLITFLIAATINASDFGFGVKSPSNNNSKTQTTMGSDIEEGDIIFSLGYGAPNWTKSAYSLNSAYIGFVGSGFGPLHAKFEYLVNDRFGIGLSINSVGMDANWKIDDGNGTVYNYEINYSSTAMNIRFNWHFFAQDGIDLYAGGGVGYKVSTYSYLTNDPLSLDFQGNLWPLSMEATGGIRYFFTENIGIYAEFGFAKSIVQAGLAVKI